MTNNNDLFKVAFESVEHGIEMLQPIYNNEKIEDFTLQLANAFALQSINDKDYTDKRYSAIFPKARENGLLNNFITTMETGQTTTSDYWIERDGNPKYLRAVAVKQQELIIVSTTDITANQQLELALERARDTAEQQKRFYDSITDTTPDLVYVFDLNYRFTYANKALLAMWGKSAEEAIGKGLRENGYEEWHAQMHEREIDEIAATKKMIRGTVSFPHAELGSRVYDYILGPVFNENGEVEAVAGTTRDITDNKQAEIKLQRSEARFRHIIEQAPIAMLLSRGEDVVVEIINKPMLQFMNKKSADEVLGKKMVDILPELAGQPALETVKNIQKTGISFRGDHQPVHLIVDGETETRYFNFSYDRIEDDSDTPAVLHIAIDATDQFLARKQLEESESRLKSVIDQTPAPTLVLRGDDLVIAQINKNMLKMIGFGEEAIGVSLLKLMPELTGQYIWEQVEKVYHQGVNFDQWEVPVSHKRTGIMQDYYYNIAYRPLIEEGRITGMIQVAIDVTEQVIARKKLEESESEYKALTESLEQQVGDRTKELHRSNEDLQQFAHVASHDLKEPIRKIKTFVGRLEHHLAAQLDETALRFIERIHVATERMFMMIDGVLAYSTINEGVQQHEAVDLNHVIKNIETDLEVALQGKSGQIQYKNLPVIDGAPVLLYQLFYNLINNSIKFAKTDTPLRIVLSAATAADQKFALITVADNGIGFEPAFAERIFETFTRLNPKDQFEGTGLGLSLCKKIAERHDGSISATGSPDGAVFTIKLPLQQKHIKI